VRQPPERIERLPEQYFTSRLARIASARPAEGAPLCVEGTELIERTYWERRDLLVSLGLDGPGWATSETFEDGEALFASVCELGLKGVVAKKQSGRYRPGQRGWVKDEEPELLSARL